LIDDVIIKSPPAKCGKYFVGVTCIKHRACFLFLQHDRFIFSRKLKHDNWLIGFEIYDLS